MGNPAAIISHMLVEFDGVKVAEVSDPANSLSRVRLLYQLQRVSNYIHNYREWEWTYTNVSVVLPPGEDSFDILGVGGLTDFLEFGREGGLYDQTRGLQLHERSRYLGARALFAQTVAGAGFGPSDEFYVWGGAIHLPYTVTSNTTLTAFYRVKSPTLTDNGSAMLIPDRYIDSVVFPGMIYQNQNMKSDQREIWGTQFREGLIQMASIEMPNKTAVRKMPLANRQW